MGSWFSFLLLALLVGPLPSAEQSLVGAVWLAETLGLQLVACGLELTCSVAWL